MSKIDIEHVVNCIPDSIERVLKVVEVHLKKYSSKPTENKNLNIYNNTKYTSKQENNYQGNSQMNYINNEFI